ncbi:MAG: hypothetical protein NTY37_10415 [Methanothrix sp.]|nr:hypothetical protein [Methanothrix sp.]
MVEFKKSREFLGNYKICYDDRCIRLHESSIGELKRLVELAVDRNQGYGIFGNSDDFHIEAMEHGIEIRRKNYNAGFFDDGYFRLKMPYNEARVLSDRIDEQLLNEFRINEVLKRKIR